VTFSSDLAALVHDLLAKSPEDRPESSELGRRPRGMPCQEASSPGSPGATVGDLADAPRRRAAAEGLADARLEHHHLLVQLAAT
jgi:hypothetical protein